MNIHALSCTSAQSSGASRHSVWDDDAPPGIEQDTWDKANVDERRQLIYPDDSTAHFDKNGTLHVTASRIPEANDNQWIQQALWRELPAHLGGALYGFGESVMHGLYDTTLFLGRSVVQIGDMLTGLANHDHPYMQELWGKQKAISNGLIYSISHPIQTARSIIHTGKEHLGLKSQIQPEQGDSGSGLVRVSAAVAIQAGLERRISGRRATTEYQPDMSSLWAYLERQSPDASRFCMR